jgi:signal transduction histidine kinase
MWRYLWRDPIVRIALLIAAAVSVPYFVPLFSPDTLAFYAELYSDLPLIVVAIAAFQYRLRHVPDRVERRFWNLLTLAFGSWLVVRIIAIAFPAEWYVDVRAGLAIDLLYVGFYLAIALALELQPHWRSSETIGELLRAFRSTGAIIFGFGLLIYFAVIPGALNPAAYDTWVPSLLLFVALDVYLFVRLAFLRVASRGTRWSRVYSWLLATVGFWMLTDGYEALSYVRTDLWRDSGTLLDLAWLPPFLGVVAAARVRDLDSATPEADAGADRHPRRDVMGGLWGGPLVAYVVALPLLHFGLNAVGLLDVYTRPAREISLAVVLLVLAVMALVYQRLLEVERDRLEAVNRQAQEQLQHAQKLEAVGQLTAGIAHDFNNLLTVILANTALLRRSLRREDHNSPTELDEIEQISRSGASLVQKLLAFAQQRSLVPVRVDVRALIEKLVPTLRRLLPENIEISALCEADLPAVLADGGTLEQIVFNLATNARDAMPGGGRLVIDCRRARLPLEDRDGRDSAPPRDYVCVAVSDTGSGMDEDTKARIFEPFFTTKPVGEGSGLGMAMVHGLVNQQHGLVEIDSEVGVGTTVYVYLPTAPYAAQSGGISVSPS